MGFVLVGTAIPLAAAQVAGAGAQPIRSIAAFEAAAFAFLAGRGHYRRRLQPSLLDDLGRIATSTTVAGMALISGRVVVAPETPVAAQAIRWWAWVTVCLVAGRLAGAVHHRRAVRNCRGGLKTLIVGTSFAGQLVARRLIDSPQLGLQPVGFLDVAGDDARDLGLPVLGRSSDLEVQVLSHGVEHVVIAFCTEPHAVLLDLLHRCRRLGLEVSLVPRLFEEMTARVHVERLGGTALLVIPPVPARSWQRSLKYLLDKVGATFCLLILGPVILLIALSIRLGPPGPVLYRQRRVGLDGREFDMLKFRTMAAVAETDEDADVAWLADTAGDCYLLGTPPTDAAADRRTPLGRFLRRTSLDELPQLWNVLRGEMSIVGPRPERVFVARNLEQVVARYGDRHRVKCGITGWAQVHDLRGTTSLVDRTELDNYYIENWSFWLDIKVLLMTLPAIERGRRCDHDRPITSITHDPGVRRACRSCVTADHFDRKLFDLRVDQPSLVGMSPPGRRGALKSRSFP